MVANSGSTNKVVVAESVAQANFLDTLHGSNGVPKINVAPVANPGTAQSQVVGATVTLNGAVSSDANGDQLTYAWTLTSKPTGSNASLTNPTSAAPSFTADVAGTYVASLVVNDGSLNSNTATVTVTAAVANVAPVANAGTAQSQVVGATVTLNGAASSDANGDQLTYAWTLTSKPTGSSAALMNPTSATPSFTADVAGAYVVSLVVNDGSLNSNAATVTVTAAVANVAPVANAGAAQNVGTGTLVTLNGAPSSDANGDQLTYAWTLTSKPTGSSASLTNPTSATPSFTADVMGTYVASLVVNDGSLNSNTATVTVTAAVASFAYVVNYGSSNVSAYTIDATTGALTSTGTYATGSATGGNPQATTLPQSITIDPTGKFAYVANWDTGLIGVSAGVSAYTINATTGALTSIGTFAAGNSPWFIAVDPTSKFAYVTNENSDYGSAYTINATTGALTSTGTFAAGTYPAAVTVDPTGRFVYVTSGGGVSAFTIDATTGALTSIGTFSTGNSNSSSIVVDPTGKFVYAANANSDNVSAYSINATTGTLTSIGTIAAGTVPQSITVDPTGKFVYVANTKSDNVSAYTINAITGALTSIGTFATGSTPECVTVDPTGKFAYVANYFSNNVSAYTIDATSGALTSTGTFAAGTMPHFIVIKR